MIDALYKQQMDRFWDRIGARLAQAGVAPNAVTFVGFALALANCAAFLWHRDLLVFGLLLALIECLDNVDGAVARMGGGSTRAGAFLDATTDRYKDVLPLFALASVRGDWPLCSAAAIGALLVSYGQARAEAAGLRPAATAGFGRFAAWPDLFERFERVAVLCAGLIVSPLLPADVAFGRDFLFYVLCALALFGHTTALQRFVRIWRALSAEPRSQRGSASDRRDVQADAVGAQRGGAERSGVVRAAPGPGPQG